ncbi:Nicotinamidase-related amidase [Duganella sp. CF517]|uniref:isochorismatase family cysteine hydrolase n=1 Tax=Duganella sp. CF517 TaxID=1881038 RepID=UPI0008AC215E|nr:isochorismatase family cysteine hydrolase [Duganella sp. CF517]SEN49930.1 Nicotinamidase-related amidase [Duganella sp. CF517]
MSSNQYARSDTALLLVDPYNDFLSEGGKLWPPVKAVAEEQNLLPNMKSVVAAVRAAGIRVFYVPHHRAEPGDMDHWQCSTPYQRSAAQILVFGKDTWGGEWHPDFVPQHGDVIAKEHWASSGFANTDLDILLRQHAIRKVIVIGLLANTCIETTAKFAMELGYQVTLVSDATAAFSKEALHAAHHINGPTYASAILSTSALLHALT